MGIGYVIDHYISYFNNKQKDDVYKVYITDVLKIISENTAKSVGGSYINVKYSEMITPPKKETRTAEEIIENIKEKLKGL